MKIEEIAKYLNLHIAVVTGFARAGFFGFSSKSGHYKNKAIQDFKKYGLQWDTSLKKRVLPAHLNPVIPGWENPPLHALAQYHVSIDKNTDSIKNVYWVVNFFFIPNYFYFPDPDSLCRLEPPKVKLKEKIIFSSNEGKQVIVYPDPAENLALVQVTGKIEKQTDEELFIEAKNSIIPVLNWLSFTTDQILPIVQQNLVKLPSGDIYFYKAKQAPLVQLNPSSFTEHKPLRDAMSLYRLGLNSNEPIYAFLSFFRAKEAVEKIKKEWFTKYKEQFKEHQDFNNFNFQNKVKLAQVIEILKSKDTLAVTRLSILSSSVQTLLELMFTLEEKEIILEATKQQYISSNSYSLDELLFFLSEFIEDIRVEKQAAGIQKAKDECRRLGRPPKLTAKEVLKAIELKQNNTSQQVANRFGVGRSTLYRHIAKYKEAS